MTTPPASTTPPAQPGDLAGAAVAQRNKRDLFNQLVGPKQPLLLEYQRFVAKPDMPDPLIGEWRQALRSDGRWKRPRLPAAATGQPNPELAPVAEPSRALAAALMIRGLARALTATAGVDDTVPAAVEHAERAGLIDATQTTARWPVFAVADQTALVLARIKSTGTQSAGFLTLLTLHISEAFPAEAGGRHPLTVGVPVLFGRDDGHGTTGRLTLAVLDGGPPGLHPDPRAMAFSEIDAAFIKASANAWATSSFVDTDACVVWTVTENLVPCDHMFRSSLGAAFAIGLDELAPRKWRPRMLRSRLLDPDCALTGKVNGDVLEAVGSYQGKLNAARRAKLRVIAPAQRFPEEIHKSDLAQKVELQLALTVQDAIRKSRRGWNRNFLIACALAVIVGIVGSATLVWARAQNAQEIAEQTQRRVAADLATRATDPLRNARTAALQALASYDLDPTTAARSAMQTIADRYEWVADNTPATGVSVTSIAANNATVFAIDRDRNLRILALPDLQSVATVHPDKPLLQVAVTNASGVDLLLGLTAAGLDVYDIVAGRAPVWRTTLTAPNFDAARAVQIATSTSGDVAVVSDDSIVSWDLTSGKSSTRQLRPADLQQNSSATVQVVAAAPEIVTYNTGEAVVTFAVNNQVWELEIGTDKLRYLTAGGTLKIHSLSRGHSSQAISGALSQLAVGTADGVFLGGTVRVEGIHGIVTSVRWSSYGDYLLASTSTTTFVVPAPNADGSAAGIQELPLQFAGTQFAAAASIGNDTKWVAAQSDGSLAIIDPTKRALSRPATIGSNAVAFTPSGHLLVTRSTGYTNEIRDLVELDLDTESQYGGYEQVGKAFDFPDVSTAPYRPFVNDVSTAGGLVLASGMDGYRQGRVWVWNAATHALVVALPFEGPPILDSDPPDIVEEVRVDPSNHQLLAFNHRTEQLRFWSTTDWSVLATLDMGLGGQFDLSPDGSTIAIVQNVIDDGTTTDAADTSETAPTMASSAQASPADGLTDRITFIDADTRTVRASVPMYGVIHVQFNPQGDRLAVVTVDNLQLLGSDGSPLPDGPTPFVLSAVGATVAWSPDGRTIAVVEGDQGTLLVNASTLSPSAAPLRTASTSEVSAAAWRYDGAILAVSAIDRSQANTMFKTVPTQLWTPAATSWAGQMCTIAGSGFTDGEWEAEVGNDIAFRDICPPSAATDATAATPPDCYPSALVARATTPIIPSWVRCFDDGVVVAGGFRNHDGIVADGIQVLQLDGNGRFDQLAEVEAAGESYGVAGTAAAAFVADTAIWESYNSKTRQVLPDSIAFTHNGLGAVSLGMTLADALAADPTLVETGDPRPHGCRYASGLTYELMFNPDGRLAYITPRDGFGARTVDGAQIGDTVLRLREIYGAAVRSGFDLVVQFDDVHKIRVFTTGGDEDATVSDTDHITRFTLDGGQLCAG